MPELSQFYGIIIKMYYNDHNPPHFHAEYGSSQIVVDVNTLAVIGGRLPPRATGLVMEWAASTRVTECLAAGEKHGTSRPN
jgi:hypothetical protein